MSRAQQAELRGGELARSPEAPTKARPTRKGNSDATLFLFLC
jgi:hypothetical protein